MTYKLAIFENRGHTLEPVRLAIIAPGSQPEEAKGAWQAGYRLLRVLDLGTDDLPGISVDELLSAPSTAARITQAFGLVDRLPRHDAPDINHQHRQEAADEMRGLLNEAYLDRDESNSPPGLNET